ncbi:MAG TPA: phosphate uptake regulator PhoU [Nitrososphaeraceae archaeon]|nr:phosphate uptake regulator PhoU [Nitrososphaeraceae archaeon]
MAKLSENSVFTAIESYQESTLVKKQIFDWSEKLRVLQEEVSDLAIELIARYQPVASDLRFIKSCMEISYGFSRFGRYSYDIVDVLETMGSISNCDKSAVLETAKTVRGMILLSLNALQSRDKNAAEKLYEMDDTVDTQYRKYLRDLITTSQGQEKSTEKLLTDSNSNPRCYISALLILRYLERISDHACYIGDSVHYIVTGVSSPRR